MEQMVGTVNLILWLPFVLVVLITGLVYCLKGYKNGVIRSAFALGATVFSAIVCVGLSMLLAWPLSKLVLPMTAPLLEGLVAPDSSFYTLVQELAGSVVSMVLALLLFPLLFMIASIVLRIVALKTSKAKFAEPQKPAKWGGLAVGFVEALVFALVLLLPLYGTIGTYAPVLSNLMGEAEEAVLVSGVGSHPLAYASSSGPFGLLYNQLGSIIYDGSAVQPAALMNDVGDIAGQIETLSSKELSEYGEEELTLIRRLRGNKAVTNILYDALGASLEEMKNAEGAEAGLLAQLNFTKEDMRLTGDAILDLAEKLIEENIRTGILKEELDMKTLMEMGLVADVAKVLNSSPSAVQFRDAMLTEALDVLLAELPAEVEDACREPLEDIVQEILNDPELLAEELDSLLELMQTDLTDLDKESGEKLLEKLREHPLIGEEKISRIENALRDAELIP